MTHQDFSSDGSGASRESRRATSRGRSTTDAVKEVASDTFARASDMARESGATARRAASETGARLNEQVRDLLDRQIGHGWSLAGDVANSFKLAADDLDQKSPFAAGLVRNLADKVEVYAEEHQDQTAEQVMRTASDFTRRQPALVFGLAAVAGFFVLRTMQSAQSHTSSPPVAPDQDDDTPDGPYG